MNQDLIDRVRTSLRDETNADTKKLLTDVLTELTKDNNLMIRVGRTVADMPTASDVLADAKRRMRENPLSCIGESFVIGDHASFRVKDAVGFVTVHGLHVIEDVGYGSIVTVAKVIMLHVTRVFGVTTQRMRESEDREGGLYVDFNRDLTPSEHKAITTFLGQPS